MRRRAKDANRPIPASVSAAFEHRVAHPGDVDLDLELEGVILEEVVRLDGDFLITARAGEGTGWWRKDGRRVDIETITKLDITVGWRHDAKIVEWCLAYLERWRANQTPLRMVAAPGRYMALIEDNSHWLPLPRTGPH